MPRIFQIELEDEVFNRLKEFCNGNESVMQDYIVNNLKEKLNQSNDKISAGEKDNLEDYLKKSQSGSRNYGVNGQGW